MKTLIYFQDADTIKNSGIGRAMSHQLKACEFAGVETTINKKDSYDLAHINTYWGKSQRLLNKLLKKKVPVIAHGHTTCEDFANSFKCWQMIAPFVKRNIYRLYGKADLVITPTPHSKSVIESYGVAKKVIAISNGIDIPAYARNPEYIKEFHEAFGLTENEKFVIGVGFPFQRKGILDFIEVAKRFPDMKFFWFGHLARIITAEKIARAMKKAPKNVIFPGYVKGSLIKGAYQSALCMFFPSFEENEGIVVLEALATHCPLVLRDIDTYRGWLQDGVNAHIKRTNEEFAEEIQKLLDHGEDPKILEAGYEVAKARDLPIIGEQLKKAYEELLAEKAK